MPKRLKVTDLVPDGRNANRHTARGSSLVNHSLRRHGAGRSILLDKDNRIIAGNNVAEQAADVGLDEVIVVETDGRQLVAVKRTDLSLDDPAGRELAIVDNRSGFLSYDLDVDLLLEFAGEGVDLDQVGFWDAEIEALLAAATRPGGDIDAEPQIDRAEELRQKWGTETGQLWALGDHRLICGDCTDKAVVERVMGGEKAAAIVTDPPYGINVDTSWLSVLNVQHGKPTNMSDAKLVGDDGSLDLSWIYKCREWVVFGFPHVARHEAYTGLLIWDKRGDGGENGLGNPVEVAASNSFNGYRLARHIWAGYVREAGEKRQPHPTQKPVGIMVDAIKLVKGGTIYDPFVGSGTTIIAAEQLNRRCLAVEIDPAYVAICLQRYQDATGRTPSLLQGP